MITVLQARLYGKFVELSVSCGSDSNSEANFSCCHKPDAWSYLQWRVVSAQIAILQIISSGRLLMYRKKSAGPIMESWGTPAITGYSCKDFPSRTPRIHLLMRKIKSGQISNLKSHKSWVCEEDKHGKP